MDTEKMMDSLQLFWEMVLGIVQFMVQFMLFIWPVTVLVIVVQLGKIGMYIYKRHRFAKSGIAEIDKLNGKDFEQYLELFFKKLGYQVKRTPYQGDYGADLILQRGDEKTVVQAKRHKGSVGVKAVQEAVASKGYYRCGKVMVVTNSYFTRQARTLAKANQVELWDRDELVSRLITSKKAATFDFASSTERLPAQHLELRPATNVSTLPTCAHCGKQVSAKVQRYCLSHSDIFNGLIYCYDHQPEIKASMPQQA